MRALRGTAWDDSVPVSAASQTGRASFPPTIGGHQK